VERKDEISPANFFLPLCHLVFLHFNFCDRLALFQPAAVSNFERAAAVFFVIVVASNQAKSQVRGVVVNGDATCPEQS
jgi:hypothetical protein